MNRTVEGDGKVSRRHMTKSTGRGAGRPQGAKNKRTVAREAAVQEVAGVIAASIPDAFEGDALAYLMAIYKDPSKSDELRLDAAKAAVRYERPALAAIDVRTDGTLTIRDILDEPMTADEWANQWVTEH